MSARKSTEVGFSKSQKPQKSAIFDSRKSTEVNGSRQKKSNEISTEVYGSVTEVIPPLKRATSAPPSSRVGRADLIAPIHTPSIPAMRKMAGRS
jgi:hypothetical protein